MMPSGCDSWLPYLWFGGASLSFLLALLSDTVGWPWLQALGGAACVFCLVGFFFEAWRDSDR